MRTRCVISRSRHGPAEEPLTRGTNRIKQWLVPPAALGLCVTGAARAQWAAVRLHDAEAFQNSRVYGITAAQQFGEAARQNPPPTTIQPIVWSGSGSGWTTLASSPNEIGQIFGVGGNQQV